MGEGDKRELEEEGNRKRRESLRGEGGGVAPPLIQWETLREHREV
jgi:hypothetical protein